MTLRLECRDRLRRQAAALVHPFRLASCRRALAATLIAVTAISMGDANAETGDREAILAVLERAFAAVQSGNPDDWRAIQLAEGTTVSFRPGTGDDPRDLEMRISSNADFIARIKPDGHEYTERWTAEPTILIRGPIAVIWGEYEFRIDGEFAHCGVDSADLVKIDGEWKIANLMWTVETENCPTAPAE